MELEARIRRINELYHKSQGEGLTEEEKEEQRQLRKEYAANIRNNLRTQLNGIDIVEKDGSVTNLGDKYGRKEAPRESSTIRRQSPGMSDTGEYKQSFRRRAIAARDNIEAETRRKKDRLIRERLVSLPEFERAGSLGLYCSYRSEVDTRDIIEIALGMGKRVFLPKCAVNDSRPELRFYRIASLSQLKKGYKGIPEPDEEGCEALSGQELELLIVPGTAFDTSGYRMGYGKGFYDAFISYYRSEASLSSSGNLKPVFTIGLAYSEQVFDKIPAEEHDVRLDMLLMDIGEIRISKV
ncbi:MAG TPA: 5-formyltetrahydrofolate cyclo-ligase [Lachnospiraceae bacterium]|nr:5-formyltetrahydrofolate cyclo-ligase [Lachnospiraceae bacterium]